MTRPYLRERRAQRIAEGQQDMLNRCTFCRRELPKLGALLAELSGTRRYCNEECLADDAERTALIGGATLMAEHIHDCSGPDLKCACGWVLRVPPIFVHFEVGSGRETLVSDAFNCETLGTAIAALRKAANDLEARR